MAKSRTRLNKAEKWSLAAACGFGVLLLAAPLWWRTLAGDPTLVIPNPAMPSPNAFDFYVAAGNALSGDINGAASEPVAGKLTAPPPIRVAPGVPNNAGPPPALPLAAPGRYSLAQKESLLTQNAPALQTLRAGFQHPFLTPPARSFAAPFPHFAKFCEMARLLLLEAQVKGARGDWNGAAQSGLDGLKLGSDTPRGAPLIGALLGTACEAIARSQMWKSVEHLNAKEARAAARRLESLIAGRVTFAQNMQEEKWSGQASLLDVFRTPNWRLQLTGGGGFQGGWRMALRANLIAKQEILVGYTRYMDAVIANARLPYAAPKTEPPAPSDPFTSMIADVYGNSGWRFANRDSQNALLLTALALRAYRLEHGAYPPDLKALAPGYLQKVPDDPFALNKPLMYKRRGAKYLLYSIGPDSRDDGGKPIVNANRNGRARAMVSPDSRGDIVAGINNR